MWSDRRLEPPAADRTMLVRERLLHRLQRRWHLPITVVVAPAGYGKTTLLAQATAANKATPLGIDCWLTCEPGLTTVSSFGAALARAVGARERGPSSSDDPATAVVEAMWQRSPQQVALILDDVHEVPAGSGAATLLASIVADLPANGHLVLAGRAPAPLPLARLDVAGRVLRIDAAELAFTDDELDEFAALRDVDRSQVISSGGWPALAELQASARPGATAHYVGEEVLAGMPAERRHRLALLAALGPIDDELVRHVLGPDADVATLVADLPLVSRIDGGFALHSLWRSLLAKDATPAEIADAQHRAGVALLERGKVEPAMRVLLDAGAWDEVNRAIVVALGPTHSPVARDVLEEWYKRLPAHVRDLPSGGLLAAVIGVEGDLGGVWEDFERCAAGFVKLGDITGELACLAKLGQIALWSDRPDLLANVVVRGSELDAAGYEEATPLACFGRAMLYDIADEGRRLLVELDRIPPGSLSEAWFGLVDWARASAHMQLGYLAEARAAAERAVTGAGTLHGQWIHWTRLQAVWYLGQLDAVLEELPPQVERVSRSGFRYSPVLMAALGSMANALRGRLTEAARYLDQARVTALALPEAPMIDTNLTFAQAILAIASDDEETAADLLSAWVDRYGIGQGVTVAAQRRHVVLLYVLVPSTRSAWDAAKLGPAWSFGRELGRAMAAVRDQGRLPMDAPALDDAGVVQAHLPVPWVAELGVAAIAAGRKDGWRLLEDSWPLTRDAAAAVERGDPTRPSNGSMRKAATKVLTRLPVPPEAPLRLRLLGGSVELRRGDAVVRDADWRRERVRLLLAYLVLRGPVSRGQVADHLWPDLDPQAQDRNLRVTLTYLLRVLEPGRARRAPSFLVRQDGINLSLHAGDWLGVDAWELDDLCDQVDEADRRGAPAEALDAALGAVALWRGEPVELLSEPWAVASFEGYRRRFTVVAVRAGELLLAQRRFTEALSLAERALSLDPWFEAAHRLVVATHRAAGSPLAARSALDRYRAANREVGVSPDEATLMVERLLDSLKP